ncbi:MAG TPA: hypothetical protein VGE54_03210 [Brevundimonas sp.]
MMRAVAIALSIAACPTTPAQACSYVSYAESGRIIDSTHLADTMVAAAWTVDLVEVESVAFIDPVAYFAEERAGAIADTRPEWVADVNADYDAYEDSYRRMGAATITYRIVERLKGPAPASFSLTGFYVRQDSEAYGWRSARELGEARATVPTGEDLYMRHLVELSDWGGPGSCSAALMALEGVRYLIFRDAEGRLLYDGSLIINRPRPATVVDSYGMTAEPVSEGDAWLEAVRVAARGPE